MEWPLPLVHLGHHGILHRTHSADYLTRVEQVNEAAQAFDFFHFVGDCFGPFSDRLCRPSSSTDPLTSLDSSDDLADSLNHKRCKFVIEPSEDFWLFLLLRKRASTSSRLFQAKWFLPSIQSDTNVPSAGISSLHGHRLLNELQTAVPSSISNFGTPSKAIFTFSLSLKASGNGSARLGRVAPKHSCRGNRRIFDRFLALPSSSMSAPEVREMAECAVSTLLIGILFIKRRDFGVSRLRENLQIILKPSEIILNRWTRHFASAFDLRSRWLRQFSRFPSRFWKRRRIWVWLNCSGTFAIVRLPEDSTSFSISCSVAILSTCSLRTNSIILLYTLQSKHRNTRYWCSLNANNAQRNDC